MQSGIEAIAALTGAQGTAATFDTPQGVSAGTAAPGLFANMLASKFQDLNSSVSAAEATLGAVATGKGVEPQDAMIGMERARISVLTFVQLRNKLVESYQDVMRMQL